MKKYGRPRRKHRQNKRLKLAYAYIRTVRLILQQIDDGTFDIWSE